MQQPAQDNDIVRSVLGGNKNDYSVLVGRYQSYVFTIVSRLIKDRAEAEDVAQEVFIRAFLSLAGFKGTSKFSTWLYSIAYTTSVSHLRKRGPMTLFAEDEQLAAYTDSHAGSFPKMGAQNTKQAVNTAIQQLPPGDAEVITLFYMAEQSMDEIAVIMGLETNNVKVKLHRARRKLKTIVEKMYGDEASLLYRS